MENINKLIEDIKQELSESNLDLGNSITYRKIMVQNSIANNVLLLRIYDKVMEKLNEKETTSDNKDI